MSTKKIHDKEHVGDAEVSGAVEDRAHQRPGTQKSTDVGALASASRTLACKPDPAGQQPQSQSADFKLDEYILRQLASSVPGELTDASAIDAAVKRYLAFEPTDAIESTRALLAVALPNSVMDGLGRASRAGLNPEVRQMDLKLSYMGAAISIDVMTALQSHRGSAEPKVSVGNVNVGSGGQAIVGHVRAPRRKGKVKKGEK